MPPPLLPVAEARRLIVEDLVPVAAETIKLEHALGRVMQANAVAQVSHPPADVSAMDGYALSLETIKEIPQTLTVSGESAAGHPYRGMVRTGEAVRIFTGACVPAGADTIVIQENTTTTESGVTINKHPRLGQHIRTAGQDFHRGDIVLGFPRRLTVRDVALLAAMNLPRVSVTRRPAIGVLSTGDEVVLPGDAIAAGQIVSANGPGLCAFVAAQGCEAFHLGVVKDDPKTLLRIAEQVRHLDMLVTSGGVSVGDHDVVKDALSSAGFKATFHKVAMRPGKPLLYGRLHNLPILGLPGNPVSAMVCAILFLGPALARLQGLPGDGPATITVQLGADLKANDNRADFIRATLTHGSGLPIATPFPVQDSGMVATLARADALILRPPHAPFVKAGEAISIIPLT
jgi:molybdopterin molybdotransferase